MDAALVEGPRFAGRELTNWRYAPSGPLPSSRSDRIRLAGNACTVTPVHVDDTPLALRTRRRHLSRSKLRDRGPRRRSYASRGWTDANRPRTQSVLHELSRYGIRHEDENLIS
jgi:hypothetical protein